MTAGRKSISDNKNWCTPIEYINAVRLVFDGTIELDPCSNEYSLVNALVEYKLPKKDGLIDVWSYKTIYVNPPYGRDPIRKTSIRDWLQRCTNAWKSYQSEVISLVPVATNTKHWQQNIFVNATSICFLKVPRLKFLQDGKVVDKGAPMSCAMVYWGNHKDRFKSVFTSFGKVMEI